MWRAPSPFVLKIGKLSIYPKSHPSLMFSCRWLFPGFLGPRILLRPLELPLPPACSPNLSPPARHPLRPIATPTSPSEFFTQARGVRRHPPLPGLLHSPTHDGWTHGLVSAHPCPVPRTLPLPPLPAVAFRPRAHSGPEHPTHLHMGRTPPFLPNPLFPSGAPPLKG